MKKYVLCLMLFFCLSANLVEAQSTYFINPSLFPGNGTETGNITDPFVSFSQVSWTSGDTYLLKSGTTMYTSTPINIGNSNISIGLYDVGINPIIQYSGTSSVINVSNVSNFTIDGIEIKGNNANVTDIGLNITGISGTSISSIVISNCKINGIKTGILTDYVSELTVKGSDVDAHFRCMDINHTSNFLVESSDFFILYDPNITGDKYGITVLSSIDYTIRHNTLHCDKFVIAHLFNVEYTPGGINNFHNNFCYGTEDVIACVRIGTALTYIYNNWLEGAQNGIIGREGAFLVAYIHHNVILNCIENGIYFPSNGYNDGFHAIIRNNVIYYSLDPDTYTALHCEIMMDQFSDVIVQNNIFYIEKLGRVYDLWNNQPNTQFDYNLYPADHLGMFKFGPNTFDNLSGWQGIVFHPDEHSDHYKSSLTSNPGSNPFISNNPSSWVDFTPLSTSNCIDLGMEVPEDLYTNYSLDYFGHYIPAGIPPSGLTGVDIGVIEYYEPEELDFVTTPPSGWYYATNDIVDADYTNLNFVHKKGNIYNDGELNYLRGVNLWGVIGPQKLVLNTYGIDDILKSIKSLGYNTVRLCYPVDIILDEINGNSQQLYQYYVDENLPGNGIFFTNGFAKTKIEVIEAIINRCNDSDIDLNIVLSHHGMEPPYPNLDPGIWYVDLISYDISVNDYYKSLFYMPEHFQQSNIVGISLMNEPFAAKWDGSSDENDFRRFVHTASYNIRAINPDWMIFVEGVKDNEVEDISNEESSLFSYNSISLGTVNDPSNDYGNAENLSSYGYNSNYPNKPYYSINENELPYHKLVFSPHTTQFEEYYVMDNISNTSYLEAVNDYKWGYLAENNAVIPGEFSAFYQSENPSITFVDQAEHAEEWFEFYVQYMAEKKLPGSFYWTINGGNEDCVTDNSSVEHCYNQSLVDASNWTPGLADKVEDYAIMFGQVDLDITDPQSANSMYSPRDGTTYSFPANCFSTVVNVKHTAHWAGEDYLTSTNPDYVEYASDVLAAMLNVEYKTSILHEFKIIAKDANGNNISISSNNYTITVQYTDDELGWVDEYFLRFYKYDDSNSEWTEVSTGVSIDQINNLATIETNEFGIFAILGLGVSATQTINLNSGWSLISSNVAPDFTDISDMLNGLPVVMLKNSDGHVFWPAYNLDQIGDWNFLEGYQINMSVPSTIEMTGLRLFPELHQVVIPTYSWCIIPYLRTTTGNISTSLSSLSWSGYYDVLKNSAGQVYWPNVNPAVTFDLYPGEGYQIRLESSETLIYPANDPGTKTSPIAESKSINVYKYYTQELYRNTDNNMVIGIPLKAWNSIPQIGDEIAAYGENGQLVGKTIFNGGNTVLLIYGDDYYTEDVVENLADGENFTIELWNSEQKTTSMYKFEKWERGNGSFEKDGVDIVKIEDSVCQEDLLSIEVHPNPGNGTFYITIISEISGNLNINIFDLNGKIIYSEQYSFISGIQNHVINLTNQKKGTYYLNISNNLGFNQTEKLVIQ